MLNGRTDFLATVIELLLVLNHHANFEIDRTNLTCLISEKSQSFRTDVCTDEPFLIIEELHFKNYFKFEKNKLKHLCAGKSMRKRV